MLCFSSDNPQVNTHLYIPGVWKILFRFWPKSKQNCLMLMYFIYYTWNLKFCLKTLYRELLFKAFQLRASQAFAFQLFILCNNQIPDSSKGHCRSACSSGFASWERAVCKILPCLRCPARIADLPFHSVHPATQILPKPVDFVTTCVVSELQLIVFRHFCIYDPNKLQNSGLKQKRLWGPVIFRVF